MNLSLLLYLVCCLAVVLPSRGSYRSSAAIKRLFADLLRDSKDELECMSWKDQQPDICAEMLKVDSGYCKDYGDQPFCKRTCSPCGPIVPVKPPAPSTECENKRDDCPFLMHLYGMNHCKGQPTYALEYCKKYCNLENENELYVKPQTGSNSFKRTAKEKMKSLQETETQLNLAIEKLKQT